MFETATFGPSIPTDVTFLKERIVDKTHTDTPRSETRTETTKKISAQDELVRRQVSALHAAQAPQDGCLLTGALARLRRSCQGTASSPKSRYETETHNQHLGE